MHTTPMPKLHEKWIYHDGELINPDGMEIPYLHFLFFKKTIYNPNNQRYWKEGFYKIEKPILQENNSIYIDIDGIRFGESH